MIPVQKYFEPRLTIHSINSFTEEHVVVIYQNKLIEVREAQTGLLAHHTNHPLLGPKTTAVCTHNTQGVVLFANGETLFILDIQTNTLRHTIRTFDGVITRLHAIDNTPYFLTGTRNGRVMFFRVDANTQLARVCSFPTKTKRTLLGKNNYVSALASHLNLIAMSGFGGDIIVMHFDTMNNQQLIHNPPVRINSLYFYTKEKLLAGNIKGELFVITLHETPKKVTLPTALESIENIIPLENTPCVLLASHKSKSLALFDVEKEKIVAYDFLSFEAVVKNVICIKKTLFVLLNNNKTLTVELDASQELSLLIEKNKLSQAYKLVESNPLLYYTKEYPILQEKFHTLCTNAMEALIHSNTKEIHSLALIFKDLPKQHATIQAILHDFKYYPKLQLLFREKKYALALSLADKYPKLQETPLYKKIEEIFENDFSFAQKQIHLGNEMMAKELLSPYLIVPSKKEICALFLRNNKAFVDFLEALSSQDYKTLFALVKNYPVFTQLSNYHTMLEHINTQLQELYELLYTMHPKIMKKRMQKLQYVPFLQQEIQSLFHVASLLEKLIDAYERNDFVRCYTLIDSSFLLSNTQLSLFLQKHWQKLMLEAESYALEGNIKGIKTTLKDFLLLPARKHKVGDLLRLSFYVKIQQLLAARKLQKAEMLIYSYIDIFGLESELKRLILQYEKLSTKKLAITLEQNVRLPRDHWIHSSIV